MQNFNHERWGICVQATRFARVCFEEAFRYGHKRKTFGKRLVGTKKIHIYPVSYYYLDHPVIRFKLAQMARQVEATYSWLELITYQYTKLGKEEAGRILGGPIALLKVNFF